MTHPVVSADFAELLVFTRVVEAGSFTAAASDLVMPKSTVSRKVADLEARLGARLLQRTTRTLSLTDVGRTYYEYSVRIIAELDAAAQAVAQTTSAPRGRLRVSAPLTFSVLGPILAEFLELYPEVEVELVCSDRRVDLIEERFDLAIRAGAMPDSSLIARKLGTVRRALFASPELLGRVGHLGHPRELEHHPCATFAPEGTTWSLTAGAKRAKVSVRPRLVVNDYDTLRAVVRAGFGFGLLPEYQCVEDLAAGRLVRALPPWAIADAPVLALYPSTRHVPPKLTAMLDLLQARLGACLAAAR